MKRDIIDRRAGRARGALVAACLAGAIGLGTIAARAADPDAATPSVRTDDGIVTGLSQGQVAAFLGIPYATPPVGDLRFRPPQPHAPWSAPLAATAYGSPCPQTARLHSPSTNEDCLFLNVFAPLHAQGRRPVTVFIHGGSFTAGNGGVTAPNGPDYAGNRIVEQSGVVVVTINYRLGVLGFLAAPALDAENAQHVSGNYGLQDQQEALRWVRRNIASFGGDPDNVTIFGESAGGISVLYQMVSPGAAGLFQRAIVESSDDGASVPLGLGEAIYAPIVAGLGCAKATDVAACLRAVPASQIVASGLAAGPIIDGVTVPQLPSVAFASGAFNKVPVIAGTNGEEGTYFISVAANAAGRALTADDFARTIAADFGAAAAPAIEAAYPLSAYPTPGQALSAVATDEFFACPTERVRASLSRYVPTYGYEFNQPDPVRNFPLPQAPGIVPEDSHTTELAYVFGQDGTGNTLPGGPDRTLSREVIGYWTSMAASGNPNLDFPVPGLRYAQDEALFDQLNAVLTKVALHGGLRGDDGRALWPAGTPNSDLVLSLATPVQLESDFGQKHHCALWASLGGPEVLIEAVPPAP